MRSAQNDAHSKPKVKQSVSYAKQIQSRFPAKIKGKRHKLMKGQLHKHGIYKPMKCRLDANRTKYTKIQVRRSEPRKLMTIITLTVNYTTKTASIRTRIARARYSIYMPSKYSQIIVRVGTFEQGGTGGQAPCKAMYINSQSHLAISAQPFMYIKIPCFFF